MAYKVIELIVPDQDVMEQEHWYYQCPLNKKNAIKWMNDYLSDNDIKEVPKKYLLRVLNHRNNGSISSIRDIVRTID